MEGGNGPTLDASNKDLVRVVLMLLHKITRSLLGGNSNQGNTLVGRLEPDNLRFFLLSVVLTASTAITMLAFGFLLLLRSLATGP